MNYTEDLDTYDSDCDDLSTAQAVLMANISNYGSEVISEEKVNKEQNNKSITAELERYEERVKTFKQAEQAFWLRLSNPTIEYFSTPPIKVEVPSELTKRSESCKKCLNLDAEFSKLKQAASGSKPLGNTKNNRISQPSSSNKINKVEDQCRSVKTRKNKKNRVNKVKCNDHVMQYTSNANSVSVFIKNAPVKDSMNDVKSGCLCTICGRTFTIVGNSCPLTGIDSTNMVPPKKTPSYSVEIQKPNIKVYSRKPKNVNNVGSSKMAKIVESKNANHSEPNQTWGSIATDIPSSSSLVMTGLVSNPISQQPCIPPNTDDWIFLFQPMFNEYFNPPTIVVSPIQEAAAPRAKVLADSLVSTSIDQDASSTSIPSSLEQEHSLIIYQGFEESPKTPTFHDDPLNESPDEDSTSQGSSSNVRQIQTPFEHLGR
nr:hypothetical protein [Tanacetum cinerariifolium]